MMERSTAIRGLRKSSFPHCQTPTRQSECAGHAGPVFLCGVQTEMFGKGHEEPVASRFTHQADPRCSELRPFIEADLRQFWPIR